jgi:anti-sigma factor RsiW
MNNPEQHPDELLPWYVNDTLSSDEQEQVELHLQQCGRCRGEVELLRAMRDASKQVVDASHGEFAWQRLKRDMKNEQRQAPAKRQWWLPSLATAAALVIAIQGVLLFNYSQQDGYGLAGQHAEGTVLQVKFNPDVPEKALRETLQSINGVIITGPSSAGLYRIRLLDTDDGQNVQQRIDALRDKRDVIDYVQRD